MAPESKDSIELHGEEKLKLVPVSGNIGAIVQDITLSAALADETIEEIKLALARNKVLMFREQFGFDDAGQEAFAARMGDPIRHPTLPMSAGTNFLIDVNAREAVAASAWHTDVTFVPAPPAMSILRAVRIPPVGGDTLFANCATAYAQFPEHFRLFLDRLRAVHSNGNDYALVHPDTPSERLESVRENYASRLYESEHPVVHVHPVTGERVLMAGTSIKRFIGFNGVNSQRLLNMLQDQITRPENTVRWHWRPGDVVIWDNRATQHRVIADFGDADRRTRRATIAGLPLVGVDGRKSAALVE